MSMVNPIFYFNRTIEIRVINFWPNGCGPQNGAFKHLSKFIPNFIFKDACSEHDKEYFLGGTEDNRKIADTRFLLKMIDNIENTKYLFKPLLKPAYLNIAQFYHKLVLEKGQKSFNYCENYIEWLARCQKNLAQIKNENGVFENLIL